MATGPRTRRRRLGLAVVALALGAALVWGGLALRYGALRANTAAERFDAIAVLGHPARDDGTPTAVLDDRVRAAVRLFEQGRAPRLVLSGGAVRNGHVEAAVMARRARELGVPAAAIVEEPTARSTVENAGRIAAWLRAEGLRSVLVVTSPSHVLRAGLVFSHTGIAYAVVPGQPSTWLQAATDRIHGLWEAWLLLRIALRGDPRLAALAEEARGAGAPPAPSASPPAPTGGP